MIKKFGDYDNTQAYGNFQTLPKGAYKLVVKGAKVESYKNGDCVKLAVDITDGEYAGFYQKDFESQKNDGKKWRGVYLINIPKDNGTERDNKTKRWFKTAIEAFEKSNPGYRWNWDEQTLKGKKIAGLFIIREFQTNEGTVKKMTALRKIISVQDYESGDFQMPEDELLEPVQQTPYSRPSADANGFTPVDPVTVDDDLPF